jgi:hypothetical protein
METNKQPRAILTIYNGGLWVNVQENEGQLRGSFSSKEAAIAVGRAHAVGARTVHVVQDEHGDVVTTTSYERPVGGQPRLAA